MAAKIHASIERAQATIDALLTLATSERATTTPEPVDLATATEDALDAAAPTISELELTVDAALAPAPAMGDRVLLERMVANLVDNAARHNHRHGWIRITAGERDATSFLEIANSGPHVAAHTIPLLFEPFGRAEQRLNPGGGVGLGLSIADTIGAAHGATLTATSRATGGLDIVVALPSSSA